MAQAKSDMSNVTGPSSISVRKERDHSPASLPASGSGSDNDASERSAREKLKKASLASMNSKTGASPPPELRRGVAPDVNDTMSAAGEKVETTVGKDRGRSQRKRSYDQSEDQEHGADISKANSETNRNLHARKRSRDVPHPEQSSSRSRSLSPATRRVTEELESQNEQSIHNNATVDRMQSPDHATQGVQSDLVSEVDSETSRSVVFGLNNPDQRGRDGTQTPVDQVDTTGGTYSPRKKRSRDPLDADVHRDQKVAATEEARAQRLSSEVERPAVASENLSSPNALSTENGSRNDQPKSVFGSISAFASDTTKAWTPSLRESPESHTTSASAFASSGFAALAQSSTSPFGRAAVKQSGQADTSARTSVDSASTWRAASKGEQVSSGGLHYDVLTSGGTLQTIDPSPFTGLEPSKPNVFGSSIFGQRFDGGFGTGNKLTSFAAPNGDANLGSSKGAIRPIGSSEHEEDVSAHGDDETEADDNNKEEADEQSQDPPVGLGDGEEGEDSRMTTKASLFAFRNNVWKESGKGTFKFNVAGADDEHGPPKTGRFIMRAHQTYRVMLNTPVFKEMKVGDSKGNEPAGKSFAFFVIEDGKPTPHMIKLSDIRDGRKLYEAVQQFQREMD